MNKDNPKNYSDNETEIVYPTQGQLKAAEIIGIDNPEENDSPEITKEFKNK